MMFVLFFLMLPILLSGMWRAVICPISIGSSFDFAEKTLYETILYILLSFCC